MNTTATNPAPQGWTEELEDRYQRHLWECWETEEEFSREEFLALLREIEKEEERDEEALLRLAPRSPLPRNRAQRRACGAFKKQRGHTFRGFGS